MLLTAVAAGAAEPPERCTAAADELRWRLSDDAQRDDRFAPLYGRSFYRTPEQVHTFGRELELQRFVRDHCPHETVPEVPRWHVVLRLSSANAPLQPVTELGTDLVSIRRALGGADLASVTIADVEAAMHVAGVDADPAAAAFVFQYLASSDRAATVAHARNTLSMAQMVAAAQYFGYLAEQRYDYNKGPSLHRLAVSPSDVTDAAAAELLGRDPERTAGNCSDIANAQAELLQKLGAKDVVVATTAHVIGLHSTVVARDPAGQTYYQLSYGWVSRSSHREGADLFHVPMVDETWADVGPGVYLNRPNGRTIAYVPTNAGKLYAEVAGMDIHEIEPLARATSSLLGTQLALPYGQSLQTFVARDPSNSWYGGLALTQSWAQHTHFPGAAGLVTAWRRNDPGLTVADFYLQVEQHAVSPELRLGRVVRGSIDGAVIVIGTYAVPFTDAADNNLGADAALILDFGAQLTAGSARSRLAGRLRVTTQLLPGVTNIAASTGTVFVNHVAITADGRARLGPTRLGELQLVAGTALLLDAFGPRLAGGIGVESRWLGVRVEATGRLVGSDPTYKEGSLRRGRLIVGVPILRQLRVSTLAEVQEAGTDAHWTLTGVLDSRF